MKPSDPDSPSERRLAETLRAALPPRPPGTPPERVSDAFFDALAAEDAAAGIRLPDVTARVVAAARRAAEAQHRGDISARRPSFRRRVAAAAALFAAIAGLAGAATVAVVASLRNDPTPAPPPAPAAPPAVLQHSSSSIDPPTPSEPDAMKKPAILPAIAAAAVLAAAPAPAEPVPAAPDNAAESASAESAAAPEDAFAFYRPEDARTFLLAWQEALLPLSSAVTQEVGAVAILPDSADSAAWFAALWPDRAPDPFPALLLDDLGDAVLTNLDAAAAAATEAPEDYDPAWLLDETLPGIPEEHRQALMPFYDPMLVTLSFESYPDASRFAELAESESASGAPPATRPPSPIVHPATNTAAGGFERAHGALGTAANGGLRTPPQAASNEKSGEEEAEVPPPPPPMPDFKLLQRLLYQELVVPYYAGPDGSTHLSCRGAREVWKFALELGRGQFALVPNREWGGAFDFVVRFGGDDPFVRFCASFGCWKWGWSDKARELRDDLAFRLAGGDATPFQSLLLAHLGQRYEPSPENLAALRDAFAAWGATLSGEFDRDDVRAWLGHWLVEDVADGGAPVLAKDTGPSPRASAIARRAADPAPDASPAPGAVPVYEDFVQATFHPLLLREIVAPLEAIERDRSAPWRPMALAALRDWCLWTARGEDRLDPLYAGRAVSAAGRGCPWPAVRFLAALKDYDDTAFNPDTVVYGRDDPAATAAAARRVVEALAVADSDPGTTPLARHAMHRAFAECRHRRGESGFGEAGSYIDLLASRPWSGPEARAVWILRPHVVDWDEALQGVSDGWLREMASGYARLTGLFAPDADEVRETIRGCFERAAALQPASPDPWIALLEFVAATPAEARAFYDEARARELDAPGADDAMIAALVRDAASCGDSLAESPSLSALLAFGDDCLATGRFDTKLPYAWAKTRFAAASLLGTGWEAPFRGAAAITNMNRVCDARLADPLLGNDDRADAYYARVWPLYANNDFAALLPACEALGAAEGKRHGFAADFAPGHPMRRRALGVAYGLAGYHHDDTVAALRHWRVEGDLPAARDAFRARAGRVSAVTNTVDNWEQSYISGRLAVLECALARPGDPPYSLLPRAGAPGPRKFWRSREETIRFFFRNEIDPEAGVWWTADGSAGQMAASEPVVPSNAVLSFVVGHYAPDPAPARFWVVPDCSADPSPPSFGSAGGSVSDHFETSPSADPQGTDSSLVTRHPSLVHGLLVEWTAPGRCTLGWAWFDLYSTNAAPVRADGPRVPVRSPHDGRIRFDLELRGGDVAVSAGGVPLPDLSRRGLVSPDSPHPVSFAGRLFVLFRAAVRATPGPAAEEPHAESAEPDPHAESAESAKTENAQ